MPICKNCGKSFPNRIIINDKTWHLTTRQFCPDCSKLGEGNRRQYIINLEKGMAYCSRCQKQKPEKEFHKRKNETPLSYCKLCSEEVKKLKFEEKLDKIISIMGGACFDCQQIFPTPVFKFWKDGKSFPISKIKNMSWERTLNILKDYQLLCLNCIAIRKWQNS